MTPVPTPPSTSPGAPLPDEGLSALEDRDRRLLAWLGAGLLAGGMPTHEVENDVQEVARAVGHPGAQVGALPTGVTVTLAAGRPSTIERVEGGLRLDQLSDVTVVAAGLRTGTISPDLALQRLATLRADKHRYAVPGLFAGGILSGIGIGLVLAPAWPSVIFAALLSPVTVVLMLLSGRNRVVRTMMPLIAAFVIGLVAFGAAQRGWIDAPLWTLIAPLAVILPGATIVTGLTELGAGAMVGGVARLAHGTMQMLLFALGVAGVVALLRVPPEGLDPTRPVELGWWAPLLGVLIVTVAISLLESLSWRILPCLLLTILATYLTQLVGMEVLGSRWVGGFLGAVAAMLVASLVEFLRPHIPRAIAFMPSFWLLVPGSVGLVSVSQIDVGLDTAAAAIVNTTVVIVALSLGVMVGSSLAQPLRAMARRVGLAHLLRPLRRGGWRD